MNKLEWKRILERHELLRELKQAEIRELLGISSEREAAPDEIIFHEGEMGNSLFLIGSGEVAVTLLREEDHRIPVATLHAGEIFGEMAILEDKPRSATVISTESSSLLEIDGGSFLEFLRKKPDLELKMLSKLSDRLRRVTDKVIFAKYSDLNRKFEALITKVDHELAYIKETKKTADLMIETTNQRVHEINERAVGVVEDSRRSQERLFQAIRVVGLVGSIAVIAAGALGYKTVSDALNVATTLNQMRPDIDYFRGGLRLYREFFEPELYKNLAVDTVFWKHIENGRYDDAKDTFSLILTSGNQEISEYLLINIMYEILKKDKRRRDIMKNVLRSARDDITKFHYRDRLLIYYLLSSAYTIDGETALYEDMRLEFEEEVKNYTGDSIKSNLENDFTPDNFLKYFLAMAVTKNIGNDYRAAKEALRNPEDDIKEKTEPIGEIWRKIP